MAPAVGCVLTERQGRAFAAHVQKSLASGTKEIVNFVFRLKNRKVYSQHRGDGRCLMNWFDVDKKGLAKLLARRGKAFVLTELIQNAWDQNVTRVNVHLAKPPGSRNATLLVEDDDPNGFANLNHAFTLFAESPKKTDPVKRGRFNLGEKMVLALCDEATILSTNGGVRFDGQGRHPLRRRRDSGSLFEGRLRLTAEEFAQCCATIRTLLPPAKILTTFNGVPLEPRTPIAEVQASLPTEVTDEEGRLVRAVRQTMVRVYEPHPDEVPTLYELGIPVVETGDRWHIDVAQKIPLNLERDNVPASYLRAVRVYVLNATSEALSAADATTAWVRDAASDKRAKDVAIRRVTNLRFGEHCVAYDPSDVEGTKRAISEGYTVVHGGHFSAGEWENIRRAGIVPPAGKVTPSPKPFSEDGKPLRLLAPESTPAEVAAVARYAERIGQLILGRPVTVRIANDFDWLFNAAYGDGLLYLNYAKLGRAWFAAEASEAVNRLLIHEYAHEYSADHLSHEYHEAICRVAAKMTDLALCHPELFQVVSTKSVAA